MKDLVVIEGQHKTPTIPDNWDYEDSVKKVKAVIYKWNNMSQDVIDTLWIARQKLSISKSDAAKIMHGSKDPCRNWTQYCDDIGSSKGVINKWLKLWYYKDDKYGKLLDARKAEIEKTLKSKITDEFTPVVYLSDFKDYLEKIEDKSVDLLLTDPPYSTEVKDIDKFVKSWLPMALAKVKDTGFAYVFIGAYPEEVKAYLNTVLPTQVLIWEYKNTGGKLAKDVYKQNYQAILFYRGSKAPDLNSVLTDELSAVMNMNAPDGRLGDRYHSWQKPIELAERFIHHSTKEGDIIIDPFCCTGTFLLAAAKLKRIATGCDNNKKNLLIAIDRGCKNG